MSLVGVVLIILVGCASDAGPNDPVKTPAELKKIGASMEKPTDGTGPSSAPPGGGKR